LPDVTEQIGNNPSHYPGLVDFLNTALSLLLSLFRNNH
jgi:hypothetical protein